MKRVGLLVCVITALALCASGQMLITFADMPSVSQPSPMPQDYPTDTYLYWDNFYYVSPLLWSGSGPGFLKGPDLRVAFIGGPMCYAQPSICHGSVRMPILPGKSLETVFQPLKISLSAGWFPNKVMVIAYYHSELVGSVVWPLTIKAQEFDFPASWTNVTELKFIPITSGGKAGSVVAYAFLVNLYK